MINWHHSFQRLVRCIATFFVLSKGLCTSMLLKLCPSFVPHFVWGFLAFWVFFLLSDFQLLITALTILPSSNICSFPPYFNFRNKCKLGIILIFSVLLCEKWDNQAILSIIKTPRHLRARDEFIPCPEVWVRYVWHLFWVLSLLGMLSNCQLITCRWERCHCIIIHQSPLRSYLLNYLKDKFLREREFWRMLIECDLRNMFYVKEIKSLYFCHSFAETRILSATKIKYFITVILLGIL